MRASKASPARPTPLLPSKSLASASAPTDAWADAKKREIAGAAAKVADEDQFVVVECSFVGAGGRDRLHFEIHTLEARSAKAERNRARANS